MNGTQVWLTPEPSSAPPAHGDGDGAEATLEWRLHPAGGFRAPAGCSHHDLWDETQSAIAMRVDAHPTGGGDTITIGTERRALASLWDGLECFPRGTATRSSPPRSSLGPVRSCRSTRPPPGSSTTHEYGKTWERSGGKASIVTMLLEELQGER